MIRCLAIDDEPLALQQCRSWNWLPNVKVR